VTLIHSSLSEIDMNVDAYVYKSLFFFLWLLMKLNTKHIRKSDDVHTFVDKGKNSYTVKPW